MIASEEIALKRARDTLAIWATALGFSVDPAARFDDMLKTVRHQIIAERDAYSSHVSAGFSRLRSLLAPSEPWKPLPPEGL